MLTTCRLDVPREHLERTKEIRAIILQPYRVFLYFQTLLLGLFLHAHLTEPIFDAQLLWLLALFCEFWLALAWFLEQMPKLFPVERDTFPDKLTSSCKYAGEDASFGLLDHNC